LVYLLTWPYRGLVLLSAWNSKLGPVIKNIGDDISNFLGGFNLLNQMRNEKLVYFTFYLKLWYFLFILLTSIILHCWIYTCNFNYVKANEAIEISYNFLSCNFFTSRQCFAYNFCANSYDDKAVTLKILQKLKLENFQVCFFGTAYCCCSALRLKA